MIVFIRSNAITADSRVGKYLDFYEGANLEYHVLGWDRLGNALKREKTTFYCRQSGYAIGGIKAAWNRILWMIFCFKQLLKIEDVKIIHGCDLDSVFPSVLYSFFFRRNINLIFDVFDWYSSTLANQNCIIRSVFKIMERISVMYSDKIIICEQERIKQIPFNISNKVLVLPNIPNFKDTSFKEKDPTMFFDNDKLTLSYVGGFYGERFLDELLLLAKNNIVNLQIAGYGDEQLETACRELSKMDNVHYYGKVSYEQGLRIMYNSDIIFAMYCKVNPNHIFAAPNKYYEAMLLEKPIISTIGTLVGDKIDSFGFGYVIEEDYNGLISLIHQISLEDIYKKGAIAYHIWNEYYKNYVDNFLNVEYRNLISNYC